MITQLLAQTAFHPKQSGTQLCERPYFGLSLTASVAFAFFQSDSLPLVRFCREARSVPFQHFPIEVPWSDPAQSQPSPSPPSLRSPVGWGGSEPGGRGPPKLRRAWGGSAGRLGPGRLPSAACFPAPARGARSGDGAGGRAPRR